MNRDAVKRWAPVTAVLAVTLSVGVGVAVGSGDAQPPDPIHVERTVTQQQVHKADTKVLTAFDTFAHPASASLVSAKDQEMLRNQLGGDAGFDRGAIEFADFSLARSAAIEGSTARAWIVPSGDEVCLILPDPEDGLAATCQTVEAIEAGRGALTLLPRAGTTRTQALAAAIVPDGGAAPALGTPDGTRKLDVTNNVAATVADLGSELRTEAGTLKLSASATK